MKFLGLAGMSPGEHSKASVPYNTAYFKYLLDFKPKQVAKGDLPQSAHPTSDILKACVASQNITEYLTCTTAHSMLPPPLPRRSSSILPEVATKPKWTYCSATSQSWKHGGCSCPSDVWPTLDATHQELFARHTICYST